MYHGTRDRRRVQTDSAKGAGSLRVSPWYFRTTFRDRPRNTQCSNATEINSIARLGNGTASPLPGYVTGRLHIARLGNGTASILPGCVTGLPRCVTGYRGFGVAHPDGRLHNGSPRFITGIPIRNRTSWVSVRNIYVNKDSLNVCINVLYMYYTTGTAYYTVN